MINRKKIAVACGLCLLYVATSLAQTVKLSIKLTGVYNSKISLQPIKGGVPGQSIRTYSFVKGGEQRVFEIPKEYLPGEFQLHFDFREKESSSPYPAELPLVIGKNDVSVTVNPNAMRAKDSLRIAGDVENFTYETVLSKTMPVRQQIGMLGQLLEQYPDHGAAVYREAAVESERLTQVYNRYLDSCTVAYKDLFVSHLFRFQRVPVQNWTLAPLQRMQELAAHWFDGFNFNDTLVIRSAQLNQYMAAYVSMAAAGATNDATRDTLLVQAGRKICRLASQGNPKVYGWFVDYLFTGYESYNIAAGTAMLDKFADDPRCLTSHKQAIATRLEGIKKLVPGFQSPVVGVHTFDDHDINIDFSNGGKPYHLLVFYDSDCSHCNELLEGLQKWNSTHAADSTLIDVYTVSVNDKRVTWEAFHGKKAYPWLDVYAPGGINSTAAGAFYLLSAPQMFVMNRDGQLAAIPATVEELMRFVERKKANELITASNRNKKKDSLNF